MMLKRVTEPVKELQSLLNQHDTTSPKLVIDGEFGAKTSNAIDAMIAPNYLKVALKEIGIYEIKGSEHHPSVLEYQKATAGRYSNDETAWCAAFVSWVMNKSGIKVPMKYPERAKEWSEFGIGVDKPIVGAIAVKSRKGGGHVCIVVGRDRVGRLLCVGGNQNDQVNIGLYYADVFESFRVPFGYKESYPLRRYAIMGTSPSSEA